MAYKDRDTLFIFLDESGNFDFSPTGSWFWSLTAFCTFHPCGGKGAFLDLLYTLADEGRGQECFHANQDKQEVRDRVFELINKVRDKHEIHCVIAEKRKAFPATYTEQRVVKGRVRIEKDEKRFYKLICKTTLQYIFERPKFSEAKRIVVVLSKLFDSPKREYIKGALSTELKAHTKCGFHIYFHPNSSDLNCQIADYCGWAIFRKWEKNDARSYNLISSEIKNEFDIFRAGTKVYY